MLADLMENMYPSYDEMKKNHSLNFSLSCLNASIEERLTLIGLICYLTHQIRLKNPDTTCYQVIMKIMQKENVLDDAHYMNFINALSIICEDMMTGTKEFSNFGLKTVKEMTDQIKKVMNSWMPF